MEHLGLLPADELPFPAFGVRRIPGAGWQLVTLAIQGDRVVAAQESEPDTRVVVGGRIIAMLERLA